MSNADNIQIEGKLGRELKYLLDEAKACKIISAPNVKTSIDSNGTRLGLQPKAGDNQGQNSNSTGAGATQWMELKPNETNANTGYKSPRDWTVNNTLWDREASLLGGDGGSNGWAGYTRQHYTNRIALKTTVQYADASYHNGTWDIGNNSISPIQFPFVQMQEVPHLAEYTDSDGVTQQVWVAPPPIPLTVIYPMIDSDTSYFNWITDIGLPMPYYKYGESLEKCTRAGFAWNSLQEGVVYQWGGKGTHNANGQPYTWDSPPLVTGPYNQDYTEPAYADLDVIYNLDPTQGDTNQSLFYPCWNEIHGNGYLAGAGGVSNSFLLTMYGWDYWNTLDNTTSIGGWYSNKIKAIKLKEPLYFGSQNHADEVIRCDWIDLNLDGRGWRYHHGNLELSHLLPSSVNDWYITQYMPTHGDSDAAPFSSYSEYYNEWVSQGSNTNVNGTPIIWLLLAYDFFGWMHSTTLDTVTDARKIGLPSWSFYFGGDSGGPNGQGNIRRGGIGS